MRVRFSEIEEARANPVAFKAKKALNKKVQIPLYPHRLVELAIHRMHKEDLDPSLVYSQLKTALEAKFAGKPSVPEALGDFDRYVAEYATQDGRYMTGWRIVSVPLPSELGAEFSVGGRIMRIDLNPRGYGAWIFSRKSKDWEGDPRFPLMKAAVADEIDADLDEIEVGTYCFEDGQHHVVACDEADVQLALNDLGELLVALR